MRAHNTNMHTHVHTCVRMCTPTERKREQSEIRKENKIAKKKRKWNWLGLEGASVGKVFVTHK